MNDDHPFGQPRRSGPDLIADLAMALRFYSRLPLGPLAWEPPELNRMAPALPFASLIIGLLPALVLVVLALVGLPGILAAGIACAVLLVITGAMAEDGLADAADGLFGGLTTVRRLEIMRDSRHGTYGVLALVILVLLRVTAVGAIAAIHPLGAAALWLAALVLARSGSLWLSVVLPPARAEGLSATVGGVSRSAFGISAGIATIVAAALSFHMVGLAGLLIAVVLIAAVVAGWTRLCQRLVGGQTGDLIGALQALLELTALTVFLGFA